MIFLINRFSLKDQWFDSHRLTKSNMAPRGNLNSFECTFNLKNKLWTVVICVIYISVLLVCFLRLILHLCLICLFICFDEFNSLWRNFHFIWYWKLGRRDDTIVGLFWYFMSISRWFGFLCLLPDCPTKDSRTARWEKVGNKMADKRRPWRPLLFSYCLFWELTHICFEN